MEQFMAARHELDITTTLNLAESITCDMKASRVPECDIERLVLWTKRQKQVEPDMKLILHITDFEAVDSELIQRLIVIFRLTDLTQRTTRTAGSVIDWGLDQRQYLARFPARPRHLASQTREVRAGYMHVNTKLHHFSFVCGYSPRPAYRDVNVYTDHG
jgi:hypothetical protein